MTGKKEEYVTEGMPFEERCKQATLSLQLLQGHILRMSTIELEYRQESSERRKKFLASLGDVARREITPFVEKMEKDAIAMGEETFKTVWDHGVHFTRLAFGSDATDIALKTVSYRSAGN